jgi:5-methylcytosine-specific restriction endonuclease McrA
MSLRRSYRTPDGKLISSCAGCKGSKRGDYQWLVPFIDQNRMSLPVNTRLGVLCLRGHGWNGTPFSLRTLGAKCVECEKKRSKNRDKAQRKAAHKKHYESNKKYYLEKASNWRKNNPEKFRQSVSASKRKAAAINGKINGEIKALQRWLKKPSVSPSALQLILQQQRQCYAAHKSYWKEERKKCQAHRTKLKYLTDLNFRLYVRSKSKARKAAMKGNASSKMTPKVISRHFARFGLHCAYCGQSGVDLQIEHVRPISKGGAHALANVVPACKSCNFSKRDHEVFGWYARQPFFSRQRWSAIFNFLESCHC